MANQRTAGSAELGFTLVLTPAEREALEVSANARGTSVANYLRSYVPELEPKVMGRPRKHPKKASATPRKAKKTNTRKRKRLQVLT